MYSCLYLSICNYHTHVLISIRQIVSIPEMERPLQDTLEVKTLENVTKWQAIDNPLAPLMDKQAQLLYEIEDVVEELYYKNHIPQVSCSLQCASIYKLHLSTLAEIFTQIIESARRCKLPNRYTRRLRQVDVCN